jgi:soluble lytic murein transglycosylase-like protein
MESGGYGYEPRVGASGEQGLPQITPKWHYKAAGIGDSNTYASKLANDPKYAIGEQARILSEYLKGQGNMYDALRQYNAGGTLENSGTYADEILKRAGLEQLLPGRNI